MINQYVFFVIAGLNFFLSNDCKCKTGCDITPLVLEIRRGNGALQPFIFIKYLHLCLRSVNILLRKVLTSTCLFICVSPFEFSCLYNLPSLAIVSLNNMIVDFERRHCFYVCGYNIQMNFEQLFLVSMRLPIHFY